jgi:uncharacterized protein YukE
LIGALRGSANVSHAFSILPFEGIGGNQMAWRMLYVKLSQVRRKERSAQRTFIAKEPEATKRRFAMKITYKTAAQSLLLLAACLAAVAQSEIAPDHFPDQASPVASTPRQVAQVRPLQTRLEDYENLLRTKREQVENARQEAISAGIQGDGAGSFIDAYQQQQMELEALQAALNPKIDEARATIAGLNSADSSARLR